MEPRLAAPLKQLDCPVRPVPLIGYSDLTSLHMFLYTCWNWVTYYGPMVATELGSETFLGSFTEKYLRLFLEENPSEFVLPELPYLSMDTLFPGEAEGELLSEPEHLCPSLGTSMSRIFKIKSFL